MKKIVSILMASLMISCLFACGKKASNEQASNNAAVTNTEVANSASVNVPAEYKQVTTNENGIKIYGKIVDANTASETGKKVIEKNVRNDKEFTADHYCIYSEYYSEAYGGTVILRTDNKDGSQEIYNENGDRFISGKAVTDMEKALANYRIGNAMADAMDKKIKGK